MKKTAYLLLVTALLLSIAGCTSATAPLPETSAPLSETPVPSSPNVSPAETATKTVDLTGHTLSIFCGAGMTKPFGEIADTFKAQTGGEIEVTYANAAQIQTQINTAKEGDLFIAGSADEVQPVKDAVTSSVDLVKHIPVLAVQKGNPLDITGLADLAKDGVRVVLGDAESTPIGKIANKALNDAGVMDKVDVVARTATAPKLFNALTMDQCDAVIIWKENVTGDAAEIVGDTDMAKYIKTIPAASLTYGDDAEALAAFLEFLNSDDAKAIWTKYGYEQIS